MSVNITENGPTGLSNVFGVVWRQSDDAYWNVLTQAFESYVGANIAHYGIAAAETGTGTGTYAFANPSPTTAIAYLVTAAASSNLAVTDLPNLFANGVRDSSSSGDPLANVLGSYAGDTAGGALQLITTAGVNVISPFVNASGALELVSGADYLNADGRAIPSPATSSGFFPNLTGASIAFEATFGNDEIMGTGQVTVPTGNQAWYVEITRDQTSQIPPTSRGKYRILATLSNGHVIPLQTGTVQMS